MGDFIKIFAEFQTNVLEEFKVRDVRHEQLVSELRDIILEDRKTIAHLTNEIVALNQKVNELENQKIESILLKE